MLIKAMSGRATRGDMRTLFSELAEWFVEIDEIARAKNIGPEPPDPVVTERN